MKKYNIGSKFKVAFKPNKVGAGYVLCKTYSGLEFISNDNSTTLCPPIKDILSVTKEDILKAISIPQYSVFEDSEGVDLLKEEIEYRFSNGVEARPMVGGIKIGCQFFRVSELVECFDTFFPEKKCIDKVTNSMLSY